MVDEPIERDPLDRLDELGREPAPRPRSQFVDRLESHLRVEYSRLTPGRSPAAWWRPGAVLPRLAIAAVIVIGGIFAAASILGDGAPAPIEVAGGGSGTAVPAATGEIRPGAGAAAGDLSPTPTPTPTPTPSPVADVAPTPTPTPTPVGGPAATVAADGSAGSAHGAATPTPALAADPTAEATVAVRQTATPSPVVRPTVTPTPARPGPPTAVMPATPLPAPTATPDVRASVAPGPSPTVAPGAIDLTCIARVVGDRVGVSCEWTDAGDPDVSDYVVMRSRNGGDAEPIAVRRAAADRAFVDRDVSAGDRLTYVVRALSGDRVVAASARQTVVVPTG